MYSRKSRLHLFGSAFCLMRVRFRDLRQEERFAEDHKSQRTAVVFIRMVGTVEASVTPPAAVDALPIRTLEFGGAAVGGLLVRMSHAVLRPLVRPIGTILVSIAAPEGRHTDQVVALEGVTAASGFGARRLI